MAGDAPAVKGVQRPKIGATIGLMRLDFLYDLYVLHVALALRSAAVFRPKSPTLKAVA